MKSKLNSVSLYAVGNRSLEIKRTCRRAISGVIQAVLLGNSSFGMWHCAARLVCRDVSENHISSNTSGIAYPVT